MTFLRNLFRTAPDPREALRPLWLRVVELSREPALYRDDGVADTVAGRFDMVTAVLAMVLLRMERDRVLTGQAALLTELFVADMDGQLRETGVGDLMVGKHVGKLMSVLGGRLGAFREALAQSDQAALAAAVARNTTMSDGDGDSAALAGRLRQFFERLCGLDSKLLLTGTFDL